MPLDPGTTLGPYRIAEVIGKGGMGSVYKAHDTRLDRTVAIKTIDGQFSERFEREARTLASLNHPNICHLHDIGPDYLVLEYIEGQPVRGPLTLEEVVRLGAQVCDALAEAHERGLIHRDLKPGNILVAASGAKVIDFGLAKAPAKRGPDDATMTMPLTAEGTLLGTVPYMAPEQLHGKEADSRSDIFALGCVLYEMYTGKRAFSGESQASTVAAIIEREPAPLRDFQPLAPAWFERLVRRCLRKRPEERWQSARDIAIELRDPPVESATVQAQAPSRWPWIAACALLGVAAAAGIAGWMRGGGAAQPKSLRMSILPPAGARFRFAGLAVSPDGNSVVFSALKDDKVQLWIRDLRTGEYRALDGTGQAYNPFFSPDGKHLGFFEAGKLKRIELAGGLIRTVCDAAAGRGGWWHDDGKIYFALAGAPSILRVAESGGKSEAAFPALHQATAFPAVLPGGVGVYSAGRSVYTTASRDAVTRGLKPAPLLHPAGAFLFWLELPDGGGDAVIVGQRFDPKAGRLSGQAARVAADGMSGTNTFSSMAVSQSGMLAHWNRAGRERTSAWKDRLGMTQSIPGDGYFAPDLSPDGIRVASAGGGVHVRTAGMAAAGVTLSPSAGRCCHPWSPDGRMVAAYSRAEGGVVIAPSDGSSKPRLAIRGETTGALDWSKDGKWLVYGQITAEGDNDIMLFPIADFLAGKAATPVPFLTTPAAERWAKLSPDGKWMAYMSEVTGANEIYVRPFDGKPAPESGGRRVSPAGGSYPRWSDDGSELFYHSTGEKLMAVAATRNGADLSFGTPVALFELPAIFSLVGAYPYDVMPGGKRFLITRSAIDADQPVIQVITNIVEEMNRR